MDENRPEAKPDMKAIFEFLDDLNAEALSIEEQRKRIRAERAKRLDAAARRILDAALGKVG